MTGSEKPVPDHASGPQCYRRAVRLLNEVTQIRVRLGEALEENPLATAREAEPILATCDRKVTEAGVWAQLAQAAAAADSEAFGWVAATATQA